MRNKDDYYIPEFDMYSFGKELCSLVKYKEMYEILSKDYAKLQQDYQGLLDSNINHNQAMLGNFLELAIHGIGGKSKTEEAN